MPNIALYLLCVAVIFGAGTALYYKIDAGGYNRCKAETALEVSKKTEQVRTIKRKVHHETQSLDRDAIVRELCQLGWVRDRGACPK